MDCNGHVLRPGTLELPRFTSKVSARKRKATRRPLCSQSGAQPGRLPLSAHHRAGARTLQCRNNDKTHAKSEAPAHGFPRNPFGRRGASDDQGWSSGRNPKPLGPNNSACAHQRPRGAGHGVPDISFSGDTRKSSHQPLRGSAIKMSRIQGNGCGRRTAPRGSLLALVA